jgi:hypothetical protein
MRGNRKFGLSHHSWIWEIETLEAADFEVVRDSTCDKQPAADKHFVKSLMQLHLYGDSKDEILEIGSLQARKSASHVLLELQKT